MTEFGRSSVAAADRGSLVVADFGSRGFCWFVKPEAPALAVLVHHDLPAIGRSARTTRATVTVGTGQASSA